MLQLHCTMYTCGDMNRRWTYCNITTCALHLFTHHIELKWATMQSNSMCCLYMVYIYTYISCQPFHVYTTCTYTKFLDIRNFPRKSTCKKCMSQLPFACTKLVTFHHATLYCVHCYNRRRVSHRTMVFFMYTVEPL